MGDTKTFSETNETVQPPQYVVKVDDGERTTYPTLIYTLKKDEVIVFGSNLEGRHGNGVAKLAANKYGAKEGVYFGLSGQSFALPTKNLTKGTVDKIHDIKYDKVGFKSLSPKQIMFYIERLYNFAFENPLLKFLVAYTQSGQNLNGYTDVDMAKMFYLDGKIPTNVIFQKGFFALIEKNGKVENYE